MPCCRMKREDITLIHIFDEDVDVDAIASSSEGSFGWLTEEDEAEGGCSDPFVENLLQLEKAKLRHRCAELCGRRQVSLSRDMVMRLMPLIILTLDIIRRVFFNIDRVWLRGLLGRCWY